MDINFHYHVTYTSAVEAGFTPAQAHIIARAARFVDEAEDVSVQTPTKIAIKNIIDTFNFSNSEVKRIASIWPVFHFLPGDFINIAASVKRELVTSPNALLAKATSLICGAESSLVEHIVNAARARYNANPDNAALIRIGITMHVLADTFAHQGFVGFPMASVNEVREVYVDSPTEEFERSRWMPIASLRGREVYSPAFSEMSFGYLGHGRIGHLPDKPGITFRYVPAWLNINSETCIYRSNPIEFYCAFMQMTNAMQYINGGFGSFNREIDRGIFFDARGGISADVQRYISLFMQAPEDSALGSVWTGRFGNPVGPYQILTGSDRAAFDNEAAAHRNEVLNACPQLRAYIQG